MSTHVKSVSRGTNLNIYTTRKRQSRIATALNFQDGIPMLSFRMQTPACTRSYVVVVEMSMDFPSRLCNRKEYAQANL